MKDNKLIAEFMGWDIESLSTIPSNLHPSNLELDNDEVLEYKYHTSWDWLWPVIRKIEDGGSDPHELINKALESRSIEVVYNEVVDAIERYNNER